MDHISLNRKVSREMARAYVPGDCHICQQTNVKVRRLRCGRHNYCRMCAEFEPRLVSGDFTCKMCSDARKTRVAQSGGTVDNFMSAHTGFRDCDTGVTVRIGDTSIITGCEDDSDDNDLEGNNEQWDHLLQTIVTPTPAPISPPFPQTSGTRNTVLGIPKKSSYLRLVLPSANVESSDSSPSPPRQTIGNTVTQLLNQKHNSTPRTVYNTDKKRVHTPINGTNDETIKHEVTSQVDNGRSYEQEECVSKPCPSSTGPTRKGRPNRRSVFGLRFEPDPTEEERGSSPCKGYHPRINTKSGEDIRTLSPTAKSESQTELEHIKYEIGDIEGPGFYSSSSSRSGSFDSMTPEYSHRKLEFDEFWDM